MATPPRCRARAPASGRRGGAGIRRPPAGAEWDAALDHALDEFDLGDGAEPARRRYGRTATPATHDAEQQPQPGCARRCQHDDQPDDVRARGAGERGRGRRGVRPAREAAKAAADRQAEAAGAASHDRAFQWGFFGGFGVLIAYVSYLVLDTIRDTLILIAIATLLAIGLDPLVNLITERGMRRGSGVAIVFLGLLVVIGAAIYAIIPPIVNEVGSFVGVGPDLINEPAEQPRRSGTWTAGSGSWTRSGTPTSCRPWAAAPPAGC